MTLDISVAAGDVADYLSDWISYQLDTRRSPGAQVAVRVGEKVIFSRGVPTAEPGNRSRRGHDRLCGAG